MGTELHRNRLLFPPAHHCCRKGLQAVLQAQQCQHILCKYLECVMQKYFVDELCKITSSN